MKTKIIGIFIIMLFISTVFPITLSSAYNKSNNTINDEKPILNIPLNPPHYEKYKLLQKIDILKQKETYKEVSYNSGWYWKQPFPNYAPNTPSGMPDFDQKQYTWKSIFDGGNNIAESIASGDDVQVHTPGSQLPPDYKVVVAPGPNCVLQTSPMGDDWACYSFCGAVSISNCFWWIDSKYSHINGIPGDGIDEFPLVEDYGAGDDHAVDNAPNLICKLANAMNITNRGITFFDDCLSGVNNWFLNTNLEDVFNIQVYYVPTFEFITEELKQDKDVVLVVYWFEDCVSIGGHAITCVGVNSEEKLIAVSDPYFDIQNTSSNPIGHNDAKKVSHDIYHVEIGNPCPNLPHNWWLPEYPFDNTLVEYAIVIDSTLESNLAVSGELRWSDVKSGSRVKGNVYVANEGDPYSMLNWEITDWPQDWGEWTFTPSNGYYLRPEDNSVMVKVQVVAPDDPNTEYTGNLKIVNTENSSDFCIIPVYLNTPRTKTTPNYPSSSLFSRFTNFFPILRSLLQRLV